MSSKTQKNKCKYVLKKGTRAGKKCGRTCRGCYCYDHKKSNLKHKKIRNKKKCAELRMITSKRNQKSKLTYQKIRNEKKCSELRMITNKRNKKDFTEPDNRSVSKIIYVNDQYCEFCNKRFKQNEYTHCTRLPHKRNAKVIIEKLEKEYPKIKFCRLYDSITLTGAITRG